MRVVQSTDAFERKINAVQTTGAADTPDTDPHDERLLQDKARLEAFVLSADFKRKKALFLTTKYRDTDEFRIARRYEKLLNDPNIRLYYEVQQSSDLQSYLAFRSNPDALGLKDLSIMEVSEKIEKLKSFEQSKAYKNYAQYHESLLVREFEELRKKMAEPEFQQANAFWANPHRWETTYEYRMEQQYNELSGKSSPATTTKRNKTPLFKKYKRVRPTFVEFFDWHKLDDSRWSAGFHSNNPRLMGNYSYTNEQQANNAGHNVSATEGILTIHTVEIPATALAWDTQRGFVEKQFAFTSDVIQTSATFKQKYGIFSAKVRCSGALHHALWLKGDRKLPHINLFHFNGTEITVGNATQHKMDGTAVRGISESRFYIYTLEWTPRALIWYVNNVEVYRTTDHVPHAPLYIGINSFIPKNISPDSGKLEVDWIKVFEARED